MHYLWNKSEKRSGIMSVSCSECFLDLLCSEDSGILSDESPEYSSDVESPLSCSDEESIAGFIKEERSFVPGSDYLARLHFRSFDAFSREESIAWILKVRAFYNFQPLTAYLSVNYLDRFLNCGHLPETNGWPMQLLSVACLSLAAKMEEPLVPSLLDFQIEGAKYIFEPRTIRKMELLVLSALDWRLRSITPFSFIYLFASKLDSTGVYVGILISRATDIILSIIREVSFLEYWPSCIAAASILCAAKEIPKLCLAEPEHAMSWCNGLSQEKIMSCYRLMQALELQDRQREAPKVIPQLRVTVRARMRSSPFSLSSSSSSSLSLASPRKRRKLNTGLWVDDDDGNSF